jgi:hypothetical protein
MNSSDPTLTDPSTGEPAVSEASLLPFGGNPGYLLGAMLIGAALWMAFSGRRD